MPTFRAAPVQVRVPATSANLGSGFDCAGLALALHDVVGVQVTERGLEVDVAGEGAESLPRTERHLLVRAMRAAFARLGGQPRGLKVVCANRIPQSRGLGSSSAAIVGGIVAARALVVGGEELLDDDAVVALATELEGHPDNVAPCFLGGLVLAWGDPMRTVRLEPHPSLAPVAYVAGAKASTRRARGMLPAEVPFADAVAQASRAALLPHAVVADPSLLLDATQDRLHQAQRAPAMPRTASLVDALRGAGIAAAVSGAGPSVLALTTADARSAALARAPRGFAPLALDVDRTGAVVLAPGG